MHLFKAPDGQLAALSAEIERRLRMPSPDPSSERSLSPFGSAPAPSVISETLEIWRLKGEALQEPGAGLGERVVATGRLHHQVRAPGGLQAAQSEQQGDHLRFAGISSGAYAEDIAGGISRLRSLGLGASSSVRLLVFPPLNVHALWVTADGGEHSGDQVLPVVDPSGGWSDAPRELVAPARFLQDLGRFLGDGSEPDPG